MNKTKSHASEKEICPRCNNEVLIAETVDPDNKTLICLFCGYYKTDSISFFLQIEDINQLREFLGLRPISEFTSINRYS